MDNILDKVQAVLDRLELMRSLEGKPLEECRAIANETLQHEGPLAEELGMSQEQHELEELSMKYGYPDDYKELKHLLMESEALCEMTFKTFSLPIRSMLDAMGLEYEFEYRMKSVYSIWRKIRNKGCTFDDVYDLFASRIIYKPMEHIPTFTAQELGISEEEMKNVPRQLDPSFMNAEIWTCWRIYTVITSLYRMQPDRIKDWITHPKPSGYQALQFTAMGPDCNWIEVQVRSQRMHEEAEHGIAAHWKYKQETKSL